jgi:hypothetical protein
MGRCEAKAIPADTCALPPRHGAEGTGLRTLHLINQEQDPVALLQLVRSIAHKHKDVKGGTMSIEEHNMSLYTCYQRPQWTNIEYYNLFKAARDVVNVHGGQAGFNKGLYDNVLQEIKSEMGLDDDDEAT